MTLTRKERVLKSLNFECPDQLPKDLGGMASTGISCFAYPGLVKALGLPERLPKVFDIRQMLALPDADVLDALDCDVVMVNTDRFTNAFEEPEKWKPFDFGGRLPALVRDPTLFTVDLDGTLHHTGGADGVVYTMPPASFVFDSLHAGQPLDLEGDLPKKELVEVAQELREHALTEANIRSIAQFCRKAREATDRAIFLNGLQADFGFHGGIATWSMLCLLEKEYVHAVQEVLTAHYIEQIEALLPSIQQDVDIIMLSADDHGAQDRTFLRPNVFQELYVPYYQRINRAIHQIAPHVKTFLHSCGAIHSILDDIIEAGFDILNPVQWPAGKHSYQAWKDTCRGRIALWGGGVNAQHLLPFGTVTEIAEQAKTVANYL
ncbi:MAG: hypothetical protein GY794_19275, partial [bacterium]|nr:hypothetical protein [bacterium]